MCDLKLGHVWLIAGLAFHFSTASARMFSVMMMILMMLMRCS